MGTGASKDTAATLMPSHHQKIKKNSSSTWTSKSQPPKKGNTGTTDIVRIGLTKLGFSPAEVTVSEGQSISIHWNATLGSNGHNIRQVVFDGQAVHSVQGGYNSGPLTQDGNFDIQFNLQGEFKFVSEGYEANSGKVLHVTVKSRHYVMAELTEERFVPSLLHIEQGNSVKWVWNSIHRAHSVREVKLCPKHCGILQTNGGTSAPMQSGSYKHEFPHPGLFYFQTEGPEDGEMQLCVVHVKETQRHHFVEVTDRRFNPRLLTVSQGDRVWWLWDRFKCKKKHRIQQMEVPTGHAVSDPFPRPVKGGFSSDAPSRAGMLSHIFHEPGVFYYCDNNYDDNREYLGVVVVKPRAKEHHVEVTAEGFYPDLSVINSGDRIWWNWDVDSIQDSFSVMQVDSCVASDNKTVAEVDCNNFCTHLTPKAAEMITNIGLATVQLSTPGVFHYRVSDTPITVGCCSVIVNPGQKNHCITVSDTGFEPKVLRVHPGDRVWWVWENTKQQHNIIQVSRHGHPTKEGFCSGLPQDSPAAFVRQFNAGAVVYYQSVALPKLYGAVVAVSQAQIHQVLVAKNHLQPDPVLAQTYDCVAWVWPVLRKHGLTQLTNTQQVFELQTYTQDVVTPRRCCALRFSNPGVYHYYSKAFSNKTDKFMYEHSSKTVLSSVVVSNPSGSFTVMVSSKGFKPPAVSIHRGQSVLWSWKGSQFETHNIVHANPPSHERPYSPVTGPLAFSSGNPQPNNSFMFTFEEPGTFYETSEGAPGCVGVVHVLDDESLSAMPIITSSSNGGVVERFHTVELQSTCTSQTASILYTLDGSIPELHGSATRVYKSEKGICLRRPGLHIIRAITISNGLLPSPVYTSKRFWVLEGNVGHSSEDDDAISMATDDFEAEMQNNGPGPTNKWQWWNCVPAISGWLHNSSDNSIEIYWDLPSVPYRGQLKSYQLYVNGICYHNDLPPTCHSITVDGLTGNQTYVISIIAQPRDSTLLPQESNKLRVTCPSIYELGGPILSCEVTDQEDAINLVWTALDYLYTEPTKYVVYVDGRETPVETKTIGDYKKCQLTLPHREVHEAPLAVFILALPGEKQSTDVSDGFLSNELQLILPLCLDNIHLPNGGSLAGKPFLIIKEGQGRPPDSKTDLLQSVEQRESFDGSVSTLTQGNVPQEDTNDAVPNRSMECEETFNRTGTEVQTNTQQDTGMDSEPQHAQNPSDSDSVSNACMDMSAKTGPAGPQHSTQNQETGHSIPEILDKGTREKDSADADVSSTNETIPVDPKQIDNTAGKLTSLNISDSQIAIGRNHAGSSEAHDDCGNLEAKSHPSVENTFPDPQPPKITENSHPVSETKLLANGRNEHVDSKRETNIPDEAELDDETGAVFEAMVENRGTTPPPNDDQASENAENVCDDQEFHTADVNVQPPETTPLIQPNKTDRDGGGMHASRVAESDQSVLHDGVSYRDHSVLPVHENPVKSSNEKAGTENCDLAKGLVVPSLPQPTAEQRVAESEQSGEEQDHNEHCSDDWHGGDEAVAVHDEINAESLHDDCGGIGSGEPVKQQHETVSLPKPIVSVRSQPTTAELHIRWQIASCEHTPYGLHHYNVCIVGRTFESSITSHARQEVSTDSGETEIQHSWNAGRGQVFVPTGLSENTAYRVSVNATYHHKTTSHRGHVKRVSHPVLCTTGGTPQAPCLMARAVGLQEVTLGWEPGRCHEDIDVMGYQLTRNGKPMSEIIPYGKMEKTIKNLQPGAKHYFTLSMVTTNAGQTKASNLITVTCPEVPDPPAIRQEPSTDDRSAVIVWHRQKNKQLTHYQVYIDSKLHGEVKPKTSKKHAYQKYTLRNLKADGHQYRVTVKAHAGWTSMKQDQPTEVTCGVLSTESNQLTVACSTMLPVSLDLRLECIHSDGVDIAWVVPDQDKASEVQGFVILKDDHPHSGSVLPPSITRATLSNLKPGSTPTVQVLAVTKPLSNDDGDEPTTSDEIEEALKKHPPSLILQSHVMRVNYDRLVQAPSRIWCELVTGHSFLVVWDKGKKQRKHFAPAERYTITWWELSKKSGEPPQSKVTADDHLLIDGLDLGTKYCVTVQAQGKHTQSHRHKGNQETKPYEVPILSQTESITVTTASPPDPPSQLTVASVGSHTVQLKWDPPTEKGAEVIGLRIYVTTQSDDSSLKTVQYLDLLPDATSAIIKSLQESAAYSLHLVTITDEFFNEGAASAESPRTKLRSLPADWNLVPEDSMWLPCVSVDTTTTGVLPPSDLSCDFDHGDAVTLMWRAPEQRTVKKYEVKWAELKSGEGLASSSDPHQILEIPNAEGTTSCDIEGLTKGTRYCFTVVAVIAEPDFGKQKQESSKKKGKRRSQHGRETIVRLASEPYVVRVPAPCVAPDVVLTGFGPSWADIYWEKPVLVSILKNTDDESGSSCLRRTLLGYTLSVNGVPYAHLKPSTKCYTVNCSPGKTYEICLTAVTTTDRSISKTLTSGGRNHDRLDSDEFEEACDRATSETVTVTLLKQQSGNIIEFEAKFHPSSERQSEDSDESNDLQGDIHLTWALQDCGTAEEQGIVGYDITWSNDFDDAERVATLPPTATSYDIPVYHNRCIYKMTLHASQYDDMWQDEPTPSIQCVIPGPPDPPALCCTSAMQEEFILEWGEPRMYGGVGIRGYQVYMNDKKVGQELSASHYKAAIPCRPNRTYHMSIVALSANPRYRDSDLSDEVLITCWSPEAHPAHPSSGTAAQRSQYRGQGDGCSKGLLCPEDISVGVLDLSETSIVLEWRLPLIGLESQELVDRIKVMWSSVAKPKELEALLKPTATQYTIRGCAPGTNHFVAVTAIDKADRVLHRSRQVTIQTTAPLTAPHLRIRSCTYSGCILEWDKPTQFGNAHLAGYQLQLNGKDHDRLPAGTSTYLFTSGKMCKQYRFTIQALCSIAHLHSQASEPAIVTWPGVVPPALHRTATTKLNAIKVTWPEPKATGGAKVQHYKVMCIEDLGTGHRATPPNRRQPLKTLGPLPADQRWAEFPHLSPHAAHTILLDTHVGGMGKALRSRPLSKQYVARRPAPPTVRVTVRGLEERRALEIEACHLVNVRHRLLQELISYQQASNPGLPPGDVEYADHSTEISDALSALAEIEDQLFQVLETLLPYTGTVAVDVEWNPVHENKDVNLSGYKVLVNGKQNGFLLHSNMDRICLQLSAYDGLHKICVVATTDHPVGNSEPSDVTVVDTSPFLPFTSYCLHSVHRKDSRHPQEGCCSYQQTLASEVSPGSSSSALIMGLHQQLDLASRRIPPASVTVLDVFDRSPHLLVPTKLTNRCPTLLLFWTRWCLASKKMMDYFVDYAKNRAGKVICLACCCNSHESPSSTHLQTLSQQIVKQGWKDDNVIRHSCSCSTSDTGLMPGSRASSASSSDRGQSGEKASGNEGIPVGSLPSSVVSVAELFGGLATPTIIILHPEGYLAWQGCFAACDRSSFTTMIDETLDSVVKTSQMSSPRSNSPKLLSRSTSVSSVTVSSLAPHQAPPRQWAEPQSSSSRTPSISTSTSSTASSSQLNGAAPRAASAPRHRRRSPRQKKMLSVDRRPFSASKENGSAVTAGGRTKSSVTI